MEYQYSGSFKTDRGKIFFSPETNSCVIIKIGDNKPAVPDGHEKWFKGEVPVFTEETVKASLGQLNGLDPTSIELVRRDPDPAATSQ